MNAAGLVNSAFPHLHLLLNQPEWKFESLYTPRRKMEKKSWSKRSEVSFSCLPYDKNVISCAGSETKFCRKKKREARESESLQSSSALRALLILLSCSAILSVASTASKRGNEQKMRNKKRTDTANTKIRTWVMIKRILHIYLTR